MQKANMKKITVAFLNLPERVGMEKIVPQIGCNVLCIFCWICGTLNE